MALTNVANIESWVKRDIDPDREAELTACCSKATKILEQISDRILERQTVTRYFDGYMALGYADEIWLHPGHRPVLHTGSDLITVSVSGSSVSVGVGYSTTYGIIAIGANEDTQCLLKRNLAPYVWGIQNVSVTYKCGYQTDLSKTTDSQLVTDEIVHLANEVAWLLFNESDWLGKDNVSHAGAAVSLNNNLSPLARATLDSLTVVNP